jgi:hypothetical protein
VKEEAAYRRSTVLRSKPDVDIAKDRLVETWETTRDVLAPRLTAAREVVSPYVDEATSRVAPYVDEARTRLQPAVDTARTRIKTEVVPAVIAAAETARETSAPARAEAKERAANALLALRGEQAKKVRRWPLALAALLAGAAAGAAVGMTRRTPESSPAPVAPTPFPAAATSGSDEQSVHGAATTSRNPGDS